MSEKTKQTKTTDKEEIQAKIDKDLATLDTFDVNDHVTATIQQTKFRGKVLNRSIRTKIKNKKGEGRVKMVVEQWKKGDAIKSSVSQIRGWCYHGLVCDPKKLERKEK